MFSLSFSKTSNNSQIKQHIFSSVNTFLNLKKNFAIPLSPTSWKCHMSQYEDLITGARLQFFMTVWSICCKPPQARAWVSVRFWSSEGCTWASLLWRWRFVDLVVRGWGARGRANYHPRYHPFLWGTFLPESGHRNF